MRTSRAFLYFLVMTVAGITLSSFFTTNSFDRPHYRFPYKQAGLSEREAAAHLLSRFTFGVRTGDVDAVIEKGLENWFDDQLNGKLSDDSIEQLLAPYDALRMNNEQIANTFPKGAQVLRMAVRDGVINKDSVNKDDKKAYRSKLEAYMREKGIRPQQELYRQLINQKIIRAVYSNNQLHEILTDFWFNHFNVSLTKNDCAEYIPVYERDAIRPNVTGNFEELLLATAKSPAMLYYLDNFSSAAVNNPETMGEYDKQKRKRIGNLAATPGDKQKRRLAAGGTEDPADMQMENNKRIKALQQNKKAQGLNENYAREVMELHTLGVDGGYTQTDVTQAARVLTGWTVFPMGKYGYGSAIKSMLDRAGEEKLKERGFIHEGDFLFVAQRHDSKEKVVLGKKFSGNEGYQEGVELLKMLAHHPSTAKFISKKLAIRFVNDNPSESLVNKMAKTFSDKNGDIKAVLITMVSSPEFWNKEAVREKTKSPFELAVSAVRSLNARIIAPYALYSWVDKMGQKLYYYQAPTGFPDKGQYWINTGALLNRMNFGLALASQRIPGIRVDLLSLNERHEPESAEAALDIYGKKIMPERDLTATNKRLTPLLNDPELVKKVNDAASKNTTQVAATANEDAVINDEMNEPAMKLKGGKKGGKNNSFTSLQMSSGNNTMLAQVVGIIIGSPEFQRR